MISSILGTLVGFAGSALPTVFDYFAEKNRTKTEILRMEKAAELKQAGYDHEIRLFEVTAQSAEHQRLIDHDIAISTHGTGFITGLQRSVRPVITYAFFALFATVEFSILQQALSADVPFTIAIEKVWDEETQGIFASVIAFWFGTREFNKRRKVSVPVANPQ